MVKLVLVGLIACAPTRLLDPQLAQNRLTGAWQADQHIVWELDWPAAPIGGPLTVETWCAAGRYRFEILESPAPALVGQTLVFDGQKAWRYNRFEATRPRSASAPALSPVSDAFSIIDTLLTVPPTSATQQADTLTNFGLTDRLSLTFENEDKLTFWLEPKTGLPVRVRFSVGNNRVDLRARQAEPLIDPPEGLFRPAEVTPEPSR